MSVGVRMDGNSQDLLYIVLSICIVWFTVFLCWLLYQAARVLRNANRIVENVTDKLELISEAVGFMRDKIDGISTNMGSMGRLVTNIVERFVIGKIQNTFDDREEGDDEEDSKPAKRSRTKAK
jgi:hypothetical protein